MSVERVVDSLGYVSFEQAERLKNLGFRQPVRAAYLKEVNWENPQKNKTVFIHNDKMRMSHLCDHNGNTGGIGKIFYSAPSQLQVQDWLFKQNKILVSAEPHVYQDCTVEWEGHIIDLRSGKPLFYSLADYYETSREEALYVCIDTALTLIEDER